MNRLAAKILIFSLLTLLASHGALAQVAGTKQPAISALELAYQKPAPWSGNKFSEPKSILERLYISSNFGVESMWESGDTVSAKSRGVKAAIALGFKIAPIHSVELNLNYGVIPYAEWLSSRLGVMYNSASYLQSIGIEARYLFNFSNFAQKRQTPPLFEIQGLVGFGIRSQNSNLTMGLTSGLRAQYNVTSKLGIYLEPAIGYYNNSFDGEDYNPLKGHIVPSVMGGITLGLGGQEGYRKVGQEKNMITDDSVAGDENNPYFAITTNTVYWAIAAPNIGVMAPIGTRFSIGLEYLSPYFNNREANYYYMAQILNCEGRFWFNKHSKLQGWFVGAYATWGYLDIQLNDSGVQSPNFTVFGASAGYVKPMGRSVSLELSGGFGLLQSSYETYYPDGDCLVWQKSGVLSMLTATRATLGVIWTPIFRNRK